MLNKRSGKTLIFRMDRDEIRIALLNLKNSDPVPEFTTVIKTPEGAIEDGDIKRPDLLEEVIGPVLDLPQYKKHRKAIFTICTGQVISETITIPAVSEKKLEKMLQANLDMYFPVSTEDHHLVYQILDKLEGEDGKEMLIQLWAIPRDMIVAYYALANMLGLGIVAMDYCGTSLVSGVGASFIKPEERDEKGRKIKEKKPKKEKKAKKPSRFGKKSKPASLDEKYQEEIRPEGKVNGETAPEESVPTELYLCLEEEHIIATFVQRGHVKMQRVFLTGYSIAAELDEVRMTLEYFVSLEGADTDKMTTILCGKMAGDPMICGDVESALDLPVVVWNCPGGPEWTLNAGAAKSEKDFGIPNLAKQMKGPSPIKTKWQGYALLASAAFLVGTVSLTVFSTLGWELDLKSLDNRQYQLMIEEAKHSGNVDRYNTYASKYDAYSYDWDVMFANLRTYNDNLARMLEEVERTVPKDAAVVTIGIADEGLGLQFACEDKEMAAYLIMSLRDLKYAELAAVSNLSVGPGATARDMLPSLAAVETSQNSLNGVLNGAVNGAINGAINGAAGALNGSEPAPNTGAGLDLSALMGMVGGSGGFDLSKLTPAQQQQLMQMYLNGELDGILGSLGGGSTTSSVDFLGQAIKNGTVTSDDMFDAMDRMTDEQRDALDDAYSTTPAPKSPYNKMSYMHKNYNQLSVRKAALEEMLTKDDFAVYRFHKAFMQDLSREDKDSILFVHIKDDLQKSGSLFGNIISGEVKEMKKTMPQLIKILTKDEKTVRRTEDLIETDKRLTNKYLYYWAVEADLRKADKDAGSIDMDDLMNDIVKNDLNNNSKELETAVEGLANKVIMSDPALRDQWEDLTGGNLPGGLGGMLGGLTGGVEEPVIEDTRIHFAVALSYKQELIEEEQRHKGLPYNAKLNKVEVE
ncbi:MAG: pilus assembly protein PilM [Firmicutes bacterium]|nr:pilus assembly protein PilM [Bacillota bacterium]